MVPGMLGSLSGVINTVLVLTHPMKRPDMMGSSKMTSWMVKGATSMLMVVLMSASGRWVRWPVMAAWIGPMAQCSLATGLMDNLMSQTWSKANMMLEAVVVLRWLTPLLKN